MNSLKLVGITIAILAVLLQTRSLASALGGGVALTGQNVAGELASMGTDFSRAMASGNSRQPLKPNVNAAKLAGVAGHTVKKGLEMARKRATPRNTVMAD